MPASLPGNVIMDGGWDSGVLLPGTAAKGWNGSSGSPTVVSSPTDGSAFAARFIVDNTKYDGYGDRSEVQMSSNEAEGQVRWYRWSFFFPVGFPGGPLGGDPTFQVVGQWHSGANGSPPLGFYVFGTGAGATLNMAMNLAVAGSSSDPRTIERYGWIPWRTSLAPLLGRWNEIVMHIGWGSTDASGWQELWFNQQRQTFNGPNGDGSTRHYKRNSDPGWGHYYKQGYYRQHQASPNPQTVYFDNFLMTDGAGGGTVTWGSTPPPPPPPPDPTLPSAPDAAGVRLGSATPNGSFNATQSNSIRGSADTLATRRKVTGYRALLRGAGTAGTTQPMRMCLVKVTSATPTDWPLVAGSLSDEVSVANNAAPAWVLFPMTTAFHLDPGVYVPALISGGSALTQYAYSNSGPLYWATDTYADGPAATWAAQAAGIAGADSTVGLAAYAIHAEPDSAPGVITLKGAISPGPHQNAADLFFGGKLTPDSVGGITSVIQRGEEIISFRQPVYWAVDDDGQDLFRIVWDGTKFIPADLE